MEQASRTRLPTHHRVCPECGLNNAPANNRDCPNCGHDPDGDVTPEKARASIDYALRTAGHDPGRALQALDGVPERYDQMGTPAVRTEVLALKKPGHAAGTQEARPGKPQGTQEACRQRDLRRNTGIGAQADRT